MVKKIVLAYSGGLDTSVAIKWLAEEYSSSVITVTVNLGQFEDLEEIGKRAYKTGAIKHYSIDALDEFSTDFIAPEIASNGLYEGKYPLATALARPLIAKKMVEVAKKEGADMVAHGSTGKGNDQVRFDVTIKALAPNIKVIAPVREWDMNRSMEIEYAKKKEIPVSIKKSEFSIDENLWGRSAESGRLEDPMTEPPEEAFGWTKSPLDAPDKPAYIDLEFKGGLPVAMNGKAMKLSSLITALNRLAGEHGIGRIDHIEDRLVGIKSREVYEAPAASVILEAHKDLEKLTLPKSILNFKAIVDSTWARLIYEGLWVDPLRQSLEAFTMSTQRYVNGSVRIKLYRGGMRVVGRSSKNSLYLSNLATYGTGSTFDQKAAIGFIEIWGLQARTARLIMDGQ